MMWNNSSSLPVIFDDGFFDHVLFYRQILWGYIGMILSICGIVGNLITIIVLLTPTMKHISTNLYLTALSCSNIFYLIIFIPYISLRYILYYRQFIEKEYFPTLSYILKFLPILTPLYDTTLLTNIYLTVAVSIDRLILIRYSLKAKQNFSQRTTLFVIISIYFFSIVYCLPFWFEQKYDYENDQYLLSEIGQKIHRYTRVYLYMLVFCLIPFCALTFVNITIIQNLIAAKRRKKSLVIKSQKRIFADFQITLMLVIIIILSVLCYVPLTALHAWYAYDAHRSSQNFVYQIFYMLGEFMLVLNASTNFLLYCFFGEKFRQILIGCFTHIITSQSERVNIQTRLFRLSLIRQKEERQRNLLSRHSTISNCDSQKRLDQQDACLLVTLSGHVPFIGEEQDSSICANGK